MSERPQPSGPANPPPIHPSKLLDSIFRDDGPMPPARFGMRALAFLMDFILLSAVASVIIWKIAMPQAHPGAFAELQAWLAEFAGNMAAGDGRDAPELSNNLADALAYARDLQLMVFWFYFALGEAFFAGSSLGKRACRLRSVSTVNLDRPPILAGFVRGSLKTICIFFPLALLPIIGALFFNKRRQMGHDFLSRTAVIDERYMPSDQTT